MDFQMEDNYWRTGTRNDNQVIYAMLGEEASDNDIYIGSMDTPELAAEAANSHNSHLATRQGLVG